MEKSVLENCGSYSGKLSEISEIMIQNIISRGQLPTKNDIWNIESEIYEAYQTILATAPDSNAITKSIQHLKHSVENTGTTINLNDLAISAVEKSIIEDGRLPKNNDVNTEGVVATVYALENVTEVAKLKVLDNLFDTEMLSNLESEVEKIKSGDEKALGGMVAFEGAAKALERYEKLDPKKEREVLARMMRLAAYDSIPNKKLLEKMAKQYGFDILEEDNGKVTVSEEKLTALFQKTVPQTSKVSKYSIEDFKMINERGARRTKTNDKYAQTSVTSLGITTSIKDEAKTEKVRNVMEGVFKEDNSEELFGLYREYPEEVKKILKVKIEICNRLQETGKAKDKLIQIQKEIDMINETIKLTNEQNKNEKSTTEKESNYDAR